MVQEEGAIQEKIKRTRPRDAECERLMQRVQELGFVPPTDHALWDTAKRLGV